MIKYLATNDLNLREIWDFKKKSRTNIIVLSDEEILELLNSDQLEMNIEILELNISPIDELGLYVTYLDYEQEEVVKAFNERGYDDYISTKHEEERSKQWME